MDSIDFWKLCDDYSIVQAAILACGGDPEDLQWEVERNSSHRPHGYVPVRTALMSAVQAGTLNARIVTFDSDFDNQGREPHNAYVTAADLNAFFRAKRMVAPFFDRSDLPPEASFRPDSPQFPRKLDAAIKAWTAVTSDPASLRGRSPKQALEKWLIEHASELGLLNKDGQPNRNGIEEICKVANWKPEGGATPTPSALPLPATVELIRLPEPKPAVPRVATTIREDFAADLDDEIPF